MARGGSREGCPVVAGRSAGRLPHRWAVPHQVWHQLFESAQQEIGRGGLQCGLFIAEDADLLTLFVAKAGGGTRVRIALGDPDSPHVAERGAEEGIGKAMTAKTRNALALYAPLHRARSAEIRLHRTVLYNSIYRGDDELLVNQHVYGVPATNTPVLHLRRAAAEKDMFNSYINGFDQIWRGYIPHAGPRDAIP